MNERLNLQDLIDLLAKKQDVTKKEAEAFLREFIAVISETIEGNESVRIKDFGIFKLVKVNARKSVDVNTGEPIEIAAHYKLSFTPDKAFKEAINKPFAHFESVILEDGMSFDNIENDNQIDADDENEAQMVIEEDILIEEEVPVNSKIISDEQKSEPENAGDVISDPSHLIEAQYINEEKDPLPIQEPVNVSKEEPDDIESMYESHNRKTKRRRFISLAFIICLIIAAFAVGGYYLQEIVAFVQGDPFHENANIVAKATDKPSLDTLYLDVGINKNKNDTTEVEIEAKPVEMKVPAEVKKDEPLAAITIEQGSTLRNISLKYYGNKSFWIYIYEENKGIIKNPNNIPIGTKLTIPAPSKYGIDAKDAASVKKARDGEAEIFSKMNS